MDIQALFDRMASELAPLGAVEDSDDHVRTLAVGGVPFARLTESGAEVYLPEGCPAREDALTRAGTSPLEGGWIAVSADDVAAWPGLFERALQGLR